MNKKLLERMSRLLYLAILLFTAHLTAQVTVFSESFATSAGATYTTANGLIGSNPTWSITRSGTDLGARITNGLLQLSNDATGAINQNGWVLAYTVSGVSAPYSDILNSNPGLVTWSFNMRQPRSNPSGPGNGFYANAFILAGTSNTTATTGSGYAVILGNSGKTDPLRLVRYTAGLRTSSAILQSSAAGFTDFGNQYLSVRITYAPGTNTWSMYVRQDGGVFLDPATGNLTFQTSNTDSGLTSTSLPLMGAFWNASTKGNQVTSFDNIKVTVAVPVIASISPPSRVAGSTAFTLTVNGSNFVNGSIIRWNGVNRSTNFVSSTQLTTAITAGDISAAGSVPVSVVTNGFESNIVTFTIDAAGVPVITTSSNVLPPMSVTTGTASSNQSFTVSGSSLTSNVTVTAPANFEVSTAAASGFQDQITLMQSGGTLTGQPVTVYARLKSSAGAGQYIGNITLTSTGATTRLVAVSGMVFAPEPSTSVSAVAFSAIGASTVTITWTNGNGASRLVVLRAGSAVNATPADGITYTASPAFGAGSEIGTGNYVVYSSAGNSVTVTGLSSSTTYHVAVYEYNGAAGTQNYKISTPALGNTTTQNPPAGLQVTTSGSVYAINFDSTVDGVNNGTFIGAGVSSAPQPGELNSNSWAFTGFSDGNIAFAGNSTEDTDYDSGSSAGGETDAGLYGFEVSPGNYALGVQPGAGDFAPGTITFRFQNQTGAAVNSLNIGYKIYIYNDEAGSSSLNFSHSANNTAYTEITTLNQASTATADAVPGWKAHYKVTTITGLNIPAGGYYYIRWSGATLTGTVFDEFAIDDLTIIATPGAIFAPFAGEAQTFVLAGNASLTGNTTVSESISFANNSYVDIGSHTLTLGGTVTGTTGGLRGGTNSNLVITGNVNRTLSFNQATPGTTNSFNNLQIATTGNNTITAGNNVAVSGTLTIDSGQTLELGISTLNGALTTVLNNGIINTQNTSATPLTSGKIWAGTGQIILNAATAQTLPAGTYNKVTINNAGGAVAGGDVTIIEALHLPLANPSSTTGSFSTGSYTLFMGGDAVNTGIGDVSGTITRNSGIISNKLYTFGHPDTSILFPPVGTLPTSMSLNLVLNQAPAAKPDAILRTYDFAQTGGTGTKAVIRAHYLDSDLNGNTENSLVDWVIVTSGPTLIEQGRSNYSTTENWVELSNVNVAFFTSSFGNELLTLANAQVPTLVWNGSQSNSWTTAANWTPVAAPSDATNIIIPDSALTNNDPMINASSTIGKLTIEPGGILNTPAGSQFTITGSVGAWINNGTFNPGTGTVTFSALDATIAGTTTFNNLTIGSGASLRALEGSETQIGGTVTKTGTWILGAFDNTVDYTGTNQTVVVPDGQSNAYNGLRITGTGAVMPASLNVSGDFTTNNTVNLTGTTITLNGIEDQEIGGSVANSFNNLTVNKSSGIVNLGADTQVNGTLTLTSGIVSLGAFDLTLANAAAGAFSETSMLSTGGSGVVRRSVGGTGSYFFPVGEQQGVPEYSPVTVNVISGTFNNAYVTANVQDVVHPDNNSNDNYLSRYWNVLQTGITDAVATISANYTEGDITGVEGSVSAAQLNGAFDLVTSPWIKFAPLSGNTLTATNALLTDGVVSSFTGISDNDVIVSITGEGIFCEGQAVVLSSEVSGGSEPYIYQWSGGLGSASSATPPTSSAGTTNYTLTVRDANGIAATDNADVEVTEAPVAGTLSGDQGICLGTAPVAITLTGNTGGVVRWETSETLGFENTAFINNTTTTLSGEEIGNVTNTLYVRAVVQNGSCDVVYTNPVSLSVVTTVWNGTVWSDGTPDANIAAVFEADYTASADIEACSIQVTNGATVTIPSTFNVILSGAINVIDGDFILENNANLLQDSPDPDINTGDITVRKNSAPLYRLDYAMWSSPVEGQLLLDFSPLTLPNRFYTYTTATDFYNIIAPDVNTFSVGKGYMIRMPDNHPDFVDEDTPGTVWTGEFIGVPHNGTIIVPLSLDGQGYNAVGNPYPSPINIHDFFDGNTSAIEQTSALYFWRKRNDPNASSYATITKLAYTANNAAGGDVGSGTFTGNPATWVINSGQGFIVQAIGSSLSFDNEMRRAVNNNQIFSNNNDISRLWLNITGQSGEFAQTAIGYTDQTSNGLDYGWDGKALSGDGSVSLYSIAQDTNLAIQARASFIESDIVPLGYRATVAGNYNITLDHVDGIFDDHDIYLKDNLQDVIHDIKAAAYNFSSEAGSFDGRFEIVYLDGSLGTPDHLSGSNEIIVYKKDKTIHISAGVDTIKDVKIFDIRGSRVYMNSRINSTEFSISDLVAQEQLLLIHITTDRGTSIKKLIY